MIEQGRKILAKVTTDDFHPIASDAMQAWLGHPPAQMHPVAEQLMDSRTTFAEVCAILTDAGAKSVNHLGQHHIVTALSSGDFGLAISAGMNAALQTALTDSAGPILDLAKRVQVRDFKPLGLPRMDTSELTHVVEGGEIKFGYATFGGESVTLKKYVQNVAITYEALLIGSGIDLVGAAVDSMTSAGGRKLTDLFRGVLVDNANLADGAPLFGGANDISAALDLAGLGTATAALANLQTSGGGLVGIRAAHLICAPEVEQTARQLCASLTNEGTAIRVTMIPGLPATHYFVQGGGDSRALTVAQTEDGLMTSERITDAMLAQHGSVDGECWRIRLETDVVANSRYLVRVAVA